MNERYVSTWLLGFTMGCLTIMAGEKIADNMEKEQVEPVKTLPIITAYKAGQEDALKTNPISFQLEQTCLSVWANKQPLEAK
jgi:hypothetical protein